jgi:peroxiredoxin
MCLRFTHSGISMLCFLAVAAGADPSAPAVLHLENDGRITGELLGSENAEVWRWSSPLFTQPLEFPLSAIRGVHYPVAAVAPRPTGEYCFELSGDDAVFGNLTALSESEVTVDATPAGSLTLRRDQVRRIYRWKGDGSAYFGPNGLAGWTAPAGTPKWREEGGHLIADQMGSVLFGDIGIPDKAIIEVGISWKSKPDFLLALGIADRDDAVRQAFRFEIWDGQLVMVGESNQDADMAVVQPVGTGAGQVRVLLHLDQLERRLTLLSRTGKPLSTLVIAGKKPPPQRGVRLVNVKGDVRLEYLRVTRWNGPPPRDVRDDQPRISRSDGSIVYGQLAAYDAKTKQFTVRDGDRETLISHDAVAEIYPTPPNGKTIPAGTAAERTLRVVLRDGSRISGKVTRIENTHFTLTSPSIKESLRFPIAEIRSLTPLRIGEVVGNAEQAAGGRSSLLETDGVSLKGRLISGGAQTGAGALVWRPDLSRNSSPLQAGFSGRIVYNIPPAPSSMPDPRTVEKAADRPLIDFAKWFGTQPKSKPAANGPKLLYLRTGDSIPCEVSRIDERGVTLKSPQSDVTFVPNEKIKSVELIPGSAPDLDKTKRDRLLTLPRVQKGFPPTHLVCSKNGDFLRGHIVDMDDVRLRIEVKLEIREIPRDRVGQIIWLHPDELQVKKQATAMENARVTRAQTINPAGNRLTFVVGACDGEIISGTSDVFGACRVKLADVDQILFGSAIEQSAAELAYHIWKLHHATEPKFVQGDAGSGDGGSAGADSPLVGQPAPAFELELLDGTKYKLADHKGKVVVMEFWATWCGFCLQSMPLVDGVTGEFADRGVELLAVNMEESPEQVKPMLDRHKFKMPVVLDRDGAAAAKYSVTSIPQVVVIDRDGKVARLFIGGGKAMAESLRKVLEELSAK